MVSRGVDIVVHAVVACDQNGVSYDYPTQNLVGEAFVEVSNLTDFEVERVGDYF